MNEYRIDPEYNTAINKKIFSKLIAGETSNLGIEVKFDSRIGKLSFYNRENKEYIEKYFYQYISGDSRFDICYEINNCNYCLKEAKFPESSIKEKFKENNISKLRLTNHIGLLKGNKVKMEYIGLFDTNLNMGIDDEKEEKSDHNQNKSKAKMKYVLLCNTNSNVSTKKTNENEKFNRNQFRRKANAAHRTVSDLYIKNELNPDNNCFDLFDILEEHIHISLYVYYRKIDYHENDYNGLVNGTYENYLKLIPIMMLVDEKNNEVLYEGEYVLDLLLKLLAAIKKQLDILDVNNLLSKIDNVGKEFKSLILFQLMLRQLAKLKKYLTIRELKSEDVDVKFYADMLLKTVKKQFDKIYYKIEGLDVTIDNEALLDKMIEYYSCLYEKRGYFMFEDINRTLIKFNFK